jgi:hypothetical protein
MVVLEIGSSPDPGANPTLDCAMELAGEHLLYSISLKRTGVYLAAAPWMATACLKPSSALMTPRMTGQSCSVCAVRWKLRGQIGSGAPA